MPSTDVLEIGKLGMIPDVPASSLPPGAVSLAHNVVFFNDGIRPTPGTIRAYDPPAIAPYFLMPWDDMGMPYWVYAGTTSVYRVAGSTHEDISKVGGYTGQNFPKWSGGVLGGVPVLITK